MPEMIGFCGRSFRVRCRPQQICTDGTSVPPGDSRVRAFRSDDVVLLEELRCSGVHHDGCKRGCALFWKDAWLRKLAEESGGVAAAALASPPHTFTTRSAGERYFCQSSEILSATRSLLLWERVRRCAGLVRTGHCGFWEVARGIMVWAYWRFDRRIRGAYPRGTLTKTPSSCLALQPGEWVEVKRLEEIVETLDSKGRNRGLHFTPDMRERCGKRFCVKTRADRIIAEGSGKVRRLQDTVLLEGATHVNTYYAFGGCPRREYQYWREIWLRRVERPCEA